MADSRYGGVAGTKQFKLCVTSPPYLNSFDYTDVYRPELFQTIFHPLAVQDSLCVGGLD